MRFKFRLQRLLELRAEAEKARARELVQAQHVADEAEAAQQMLEGAHQQSRDQLQAATTTAPRVGHLRQLGTVLDALEVRIERATEVLVAAEADVARAQGAFAEASRDRRVLDRLRDRHAEAWHTEMAQQDRVRMDEIALTQFTRRHEATLSNDGAAATPSMDVTA